MILNSPYISGSLTVTGNIIASGSITISGSIASASFAANATSASYAVNATSASYAVATTSASYAVASTSASYAVNATSASFAIQAQTASFANTFTVNSTLTAQTLVVQTITSSVDFVTGSTRFGSLLDNTHVFSGSVTMNPGGLFVSSSGLVGIGTISPRSTFDVRFNADRGIRFSSPGVSTEAVITSYQGDVTNNIRTLRIAGDIIYFNTGDGTNPSGSVRVTMDSGGNVGIGTSAPKTNLQISNVSGADLLSFGISNYQDWVGGKIDLQGISAFGADMTFYTHPANSSNNATVVERMRITSGGNVSIGGLTSPGRLLTLYKSSTPILQFVDATTGTASGNGFLIYNGGLNAYLENTSNGFMQFQTNSQVKLNLGANANSDVYISSYTGYQHLFSGGDQYNTLLNGSGAIMYLNYQGNGAIKAGTSQTVLYAGSDIRIKKDISLVDSTLNKVLALTPKTFKYKDNKADYTYYGFIAQDMEEIFPELVRTDNGISMCNDEEIVNQKSIESYGLVWASILTKAIQELKAQNDDLQQQINELKAQ